MIEQYCMTDILLDSIKEIFETMIFMSVEPMEKETIEKSGETLLGSITFKGEIEGCLSVSCGMVGAKTIAANMLCMDSPDEVSEEDLADAMGEVSNMVMGSIKTRLQESVPTIELSIPSVVVGCALRRSLGEGASKSQLVVQVGDTYEVELSFVSRKNG